jgi:hypothetical protein
MQNERLPEDQPGSTDPDPKPPGEPPRRPREVGGPPGPEPTRFGDWEKGGRCIDF